MENKPDRKEEQDQRVFVRDIWELILKLLLILIFVAWFIAEYVTGKEINIITLIVLLLVLAGLIGLILRQKHFVLLQCKLTDPGGCVRGDTNILAGRILEPVLGDATGWGFSHYLLELYSPNGTLIPGSMVYPDGSGNPATSATQGNYAKSAATLGWVDVEKAVSGAGIALLTSTSFEIVLRVFGVDGSEKSSPCTITFSISANEVYIKRVSTPWSVDFVDPDEPLRASDDAAAILATVGGRLHVRGAANIYGCSGENIEEYSIWAIPDPTFSLAQPAPFTAVTPAPDWVPVSHVEFKAQTVDSTTYTADQVRAYNELDGDPNPDILTNTWGTRTESICFMIDFSLHCISWKIPDLKAQAFNTRSPLGTGKFTFLLQVIDTSGNTFYDVQRVWVDNEPVEAVIDGVGNVPACADLYTKDQSGTFKTVAVRGTAWDPLIDPADPTKPTSDNFHRYTLKFQKQGAAGEAELVDSPDPIPSRPSPSGVGDLANWDLSWLDKASNPQSLPNDQLLADGEECAYDVILRVWDKTIVDEHTVHYSGKVTFPIKVINSSEP